MVCYFLLISRIRVTVGSLAPWKQNVLPQLGNFLGVLQVQPQKPQTELPYRNKLFLFTDKSDIERNASHLLTQRTNRTCCKTFLLTTGSPREPWPSCSLCASKQLRARFTLKIILWWDDHGYIPSAHERLFDIPLLTRIEEKICNKRLILGDKGM